MTPPTSAFARAAARASFVLILLAPRAALADAHAEAVAKEAIAKAHTDYAAGSYADAVAALTQAAHACGAGGGPSRCAVPTKATLLRDLGTMQFRAGDKDAAEQTFGEALSIDSSLKLDPAYDASDVGAAFEDARAIAGLPAAPVSTKPPPGSAGAAPGAAAPSGGTTGPSTAPAGGPPAPPEEQPKGGDFVHEPPREQRENTPLPIYVEYAGKSPPARVVVKYKGAQMRDWARVELRREGRGYAGLIPCGDVTVGTMRYWVQGFDRAGEPMAESGGPKHPFFVPIREELSGAPPHLPGQPPPKACADTDCPPGMAGCGGAAAGGEGAGAAAPSAPASGATTGGEPQSGPPAHARKLWLGVSFSVEFLVLPSATNVCKVDDRTGKPVNSAGYYCFGFDPGTNFPTTGRTNVSFPASQQVNDTIVDGGSVPGGLTFGDERLVASLDYALGSHLLVGGRAGVTFNMYPGRGQAFGPLYLEARGTYVFGKAPLDSPAVKAAPIALVGAGVAEFDGRTTTHDMMLNGFFGGQTEDAWLPNGPFFITVGGGGRFLLSSRVALTAALRLNLSFGSIGVLPTYGPEVGLAYGL